ncbi:MAG: rod shape-determining protein MreD [Peptococcaceae bacterium]|jgi:rod shape-determining protein MreD|nr:rod shape-determining protein MreD [Peptococcaceae bacterium]MDH7524242.1 rod shape-determining protein MreD [Peptococcaceae bacterium]
MREYMTLFLFALTGLVMQSTIFNHIALAGIKPDFVLILAIFFSILCGPRRGTIVGFLLGLLEDVYLGRFIGMNAFSKGATSFLVGWISRGAFSENLLIPIISMFAGTFFNSALYFLAGKALGLQWSMRLWLWNSIPLAIYNTCLVPFIYPRFFHLASRFNENRINPKFWDRFS